jgi:hypothetical protein
MLESTEIRWFFEGNLPSEIKKQFEIFHTSDMNENRVDFYLLLMNNDQVGIKLRNSRLEIKYRSEARPFDFPQSCLNGNLERWTRLEWNDKAAFIEFMSILDKKELTPWVKVSKKRIQRKFSVNEDEELVIQPSSQLSSDFTIEVTELTANNQTWWCIAVDSFTDKDSLYFSKIINRQITDHYNVDLKKEWSFGYPHWLSQVFK